jgi:hypothetical protein
VYAHTHTIHWHISDIIKAERLTAETLGKQKSFPMPKLITPRLQDLRKHSTAESEKSFGG